MGRRLMALRVKKRMAQPWKCNLYCRRSTRWNESNFDTNKYVVSRKKAGKVVLTSTNVVSSDGKTMTITTKGVDADGRPVNNVRVYDRQ